jgi:hypothetical protein
VKIISDRRSVLSRLKMARTRRVPILSPNAETLDEMEAILLAAQQFAVETNSARVTMGISITAGYPDHPQLVRLHPLARWQGGAPGRCRHSEGRTAAGRLTLARLARFLQTRSLVQSCGSDSILGLCT